MMKVMTKARMMVRANLQVGLELGQVEVYLVIESWILIDRIISPAKCLRYCLISRYINVN